jgi:hypothetical protein
MNDQVRKRPVLRQVSPSPSEAVPVRHEHWIGTRGRLVAALLFILAGAAGALWWNLRSTQPYDT